MDNPATLRLCKIATIVALVLMMPIRVVQGTNPTRFAVSVVGQTLTAGFNNNVTMMVEYPASVYSSGPAYDVDLAVTVSSPLQLLGDNHWRYDSVAPGEFANVSFEIYAPTAAIGDSYESSVTVTYREIGDISYTEETHSFSFSVRGWIDLVLYGIQITSTAAVPGGNATISGNLLNKGNVAAYNANVTVESEALAQGSTASIFLGEVDANIPRPFSLLINFRKNLADGNYSIVVKVSAVDTNLPASPYVVQQESQLQIKKAATQPPSGPQPATGGPMETIFEILRALYGLFFGSPTLAISGG